MVLFTGTVLAFQFFFVGQKDQCFVAECIVMYYSNISPLFLVCEVTHWLKKNCNMKWIYNSKHDLDDDTASHNNPIARWYINLSPAQDSRHVISTTFLQHFEILFLRIWFFEAMRVVVVWVVGSHENWYMSSFLMNSLWQNLTVAKLT